MKIAGTSEKFLGGVKGLVELIPNNRQALLGAFSSLRYHDFRLYFTGQIISLIGTWMQQIAMSWLVYRLTGSVLLLATVAFAAQIPSLVVTPFAGVIIDRMNCRKILFFTQILSMLEALTLATLVLTGAIQVWHIIALAVFIGTVNSIDNPTRQTFYKDVVPKDELTNAIALNSAMINGARFIGPTVGGLLVAWVGEGLCFLINGVSYIAVLWALAAMRVRYQPKPRKHTRMIDELREGVTYAFDYLPIRAVLIIVAVQSFFALPFQTVLPAYVVDVLGKDSKMQGIMMSSIGVGALTAALYLAARKKVQGLAKMVTLSGLMFGSGLIAVSLVRVPWVAAVFCYPIGFAMISMFASCNTLLQTLVDHDKLGRVMSLYTVSFMGMAPLGCLLQGVVVKAFSLPWVIGAAGVISIAAGLVFERFRPAIRRAARDGYTPKGIVPEIAIGIGLTNNR
ncbi:MAG: MFS transporter [Rikenellaceae bacterium]|jgi:MFS family permease|nr:MFS transporter [Rikenellaceae bacterium]